MKSDGSCCIWDFLASGAPYLHVVVIVQKPDLGVSRDPASFLLFALAVYRIAKNDWHRIFFISLGHVRLGSFIGSFQGIC